MLYHFELQICKSPNNNTENLKLHKPKKFNILTQFSYKTVSNQCPCEVNCNSYLQLSNNKTKQQNNIADNKITK